MKLFSVISCFLIAALLNGCGSDEKINTDSKNKDDTPALEKVVSVDLKLVLKAHVNRISLEWTGIEGAQEYLIYRLQTEDLHPYVESFIADDTTYSFITNGQQTYQVWIEVLDSQGEVINSSDKVTVTSENPEVELAFDDGFF